MIADAIQLTGKQRADVCAPTACAHCGLDVPPGLLQPGRESQFCCQGCRAAHAIIHGGGLERYYRLREQTARSPATPVRASGRAYTDFDDPAFASLYCRPSPGGLTAAELFLEGVHCAACAWLVERLPRLVTGVAEARLDLGRSMVRLTWDGHRASLSAIARALDTLGYPAHPAREGTARAIRRMDDRKGMIRLAVAGACAGNVMLLALALYAGVFGAMEPAWVSFFRWLSMAISLVSIAWPGSVFFRGALGALRARTLSLDVPIALGLGAGAAWCVWSTVTGRGEVYFDSLSVLVFALLLGRWVQRRRQRSTADAVELLFSLTPSAARLVEGDAVREVPVEALRRGDRVEVRAGDSIPADGVVCQGRSSVDESVLTGESRPRPAAPGDQVCAGAVNLSSRLVVTVEATGEQTRAGRLMRLVEEGTRRRAPIVQLADRIAGCFLGIVVLAAAGTAAWWWRPDAARAIEHAAALLIVTCPCALGLATPLAVTVAIGRAARRGILIKGGDTLEKLARPGLVFLDKTGTITHGRVSLVRWRGPEWVKPLAAAVESASSHLIARALVAGLGPASVAADATVIETTGRGIEGRVAGRDVIVGSDVFLRSRGALASSRLAGEAAKLAAEGLTPVFVAVNGQVEAVAGLGDAVRPDAAEAVAGLRRLGWRVSILSGDDPRVVAAVAAQVGIHDARGGMSPEDKLAAVTAAAAEGTAVMVGDGVNDAAALAAATVGIAVHGGAEASLAAADVHIGRPGLAPVADLAGAAQRTLAVIRRNLAASLLYNAVAGALAASGWITPLLAAVLMPMSSLTVVGLSVRARTFGGRRWPC